jgi:hypothetical protein
MANEKLQINSRNTMKNQNKESLTQILSKQILISIFMNDYV